MSFARYVADLDITPGRAYAPFWSALIQVLRDTMDHQARQGRAQSTMRVSTCVTSERFALVVEDDGPGSDWDAVRTACEALGGTVETESRNGGGNRISFAFPTHGTESESSVAVPSRAGRQGTSAA